MAHQDYSEICPIFTEGVERELAIDVPLDTASVSLAFGQIPMGREADTVEAYGWWEGQSGSTTISGSCVIGLFKNTLSTQFASISLGTVSTPTPVAASIVATTFTSTDVVCAAMTTKNTGGFRCHTILRYKDK